jgi:hypothetical protein
MAVLTTIELENHGIFANVIDSGTVNCRVCCAFKKGHGGLMADSSVAMD